MDHAVGVEAFCLAEFPRLVGALDVLLGDRALAEDLAHEALARVWARWDRVAGMERPGGYAHRIAINLARRHLRRQVRERVLLGRLASEPTSGDEAFDRAAVLSVRDAVAALPPRQRAAVVCRYFADLSVAETAQALGCRPGTVKALTSQAITNLRSAGLTEEVPT